ncbi:MAG TPA: GNVR domain-containing protein [Candidatus Binatia bacterium]|nr:GNVR domain-containing protein [Candidatus Binatia bacterium]
MNEPETAQVPWREFIAIMFRNRTLIACVVTSGVITSLVLSFLQAPAYRAAAKLMVSSKRARITVSPDPKDGPTIDRVTDQELSSEVALLQSMPLVREVLESYRGTMDTSGHSSNLVRLVMYPLHLPGAIYRTLYKIPPPSPQEDWAQSVMKRLSVSELRGSNLIEVAYEDANPQWTADLVNAVVKRHVERHVQLNQQSDALGFFESQRRLLSERLHDADAALQAFYQREGVDPGDTQRDGLTEQLSTLRTSLAESETDLAGAEARVKFLSQTLNSHVRSQSAEPGKAQSGPLQLIRSRVLELELQRSELLSKFAPTSTKIQDIDRQIQEARRLLAQEEKSGGVAADMADSKQQKLDMELAQTQARIAALRARGDALRERIAASEGKLQHLGQIASEQERLEQEVATAKEASTTYIRKREEARFSDALDESRIVNVSIVEPAVVPTAPLPTKRLLTLVLGSVMSLFVGIGLAFVRDRLDPALKGGAEAQRITGLPILANIPS